MAPGEEGEGSRVRGCGEASKYDEIGICTSWKCFKIKVHPYVYKPAEDSVLALEALRKLYERGSRYERIVDLGTGTGILALGAYELFNPSILLAVDISPYAVRNARLNLPPEVHVAQCDGLKCFNTKWDLVIVNPPYLPIEPENPEATQNWWLEISWSGAYSMERLVRESVEKGEEVLLVHSTVSPMNVEDVVGSCSIEVLESAKFFFEEIKVSLLKPRQ
jgi:release factor glutamine methyltransferase